MKPIRSNPTAALALLLAGLLAASGCVDSPSPTAGVEIEAPTDDAGVGRQHEPEGAADADDEADAVDLDDADFEEDGGGEPPPCESAAFWSPARAQVEASVVDTAGPDHPMITLIPHLEALDTGSGLRAFVCKKMSTFVNATVATTITAVGGVGEGRAIFDGQMVSEAQSCTDPVEIPAEALALWAQGDALRPAFRIVSPAQCADVWDPLCEIHPEPGCGYCWWVELPAMARTCRTMP